MPIDVGTQAPGFTLKDQNNQEVTLADFRGRKAVAILFYPYAFSGVCAGEMAGVRDRLAQLSNRLADAEWLDGPFSAADLMMVSVLLRIKPPGLLGEYPNLAAYVARGEARPAYKRAFAAQLAVFAESRAK